METNLTWFTSTRTSHVTTSILLALGVDEQGKKISDSNNFFNSKKITRALEQKYGLLPAEKQKQTEGYRYRKVNPDEGNIKEAGSIGHRTTDEVL